jgi:hypothetical protein
MYKLSPSKAHRFLHCTASLKHDLPFVETPATIRGNILHKLAEMYLCGYDSQIIYDYIDTNKINDYEQFLINTYVNNVWREFDQIGARQIIVEQKQPIQIYDNKINLIIDALLVAPTEVSIIDLKTGNADVDAEDNEQLLFYGYAEAVKNPHLKNIRLSIFQKGKLKTFEQTPSEIFDFFIGHHKTFDEINKNELTYKPSEKACKYCAIKGTCVERARWIFEGKDGQSEI